MNGFITFNVLFLIATIVLQNYVLTSAFIYFQVYNLVMLVKINMVLIVTALRTKWLVEKTTKSVSAKKPIPL